MNISPAIVRTKMGFVPDTGKYFDKTTDSSFDDKTNYSIVLFYENSGITAGQHGNGVLFSIWDGDSVDSGFFIHCYGGITYYFTGDGENGSAYSAITNTDNYSWGDGGSGGPTNCIAMTYDASSNTKVSYNINSGSYLRTSGIYSSTNWGTLGTNTEVRIGNHWDGSGASTYQCDTKFKIGSCGLWYSTLSEANILALCNITSSPSDSDTDIGMVYDIGYSAAGVTQPNHLWLSNQTDSFADFAAGTDRGSATAVTLDLNGTPAQGLHPL